MEIKNSTSVMHINASWISGLIFEWHITLTCFISCEIRRWAKMHATRDAGDIIFIVNATDLAATITRARAAAKIAHLKARGVKAPRVHFAVALLIARNDRGSFDNSGGIARVFIISLNDVNFVPRTCQLPGSRIPPARFFRARSGRTIAGLPR